jgi:hypothetical protein
MTGFRLLWRPAWTLKLTLFEASRAANPLDDSKRGNTTTDIMIEPGEQPIEWDLLWWT